MQTDCSASFCYMPLSKQDRIRLFVSLLHSPPAKGGFL